MHDLDITYPAWLDAQSEDARYIPADGICMICDRLVRGHHGVEMVLALRKIKSWDSETGNIVVKGGIPYCLCEQKAPVPGSAT